MKISRYQHKKIIKKKQQKNALRNHIVNFLYAWTLLHPYKNNKKGKITRNIVYVIDYNKIIKIVFINQPRVG